MEFDYSEEKDLILKEVRGIGFQDVINAIKKGSLLADINHFNKQKYPKQKIFILEINNEVYAVPYIKDIQRKVTFLKTIYPSRKLKERYLK